MNTRTSNATKFLLQTAINEAQTVGYKFPHINLSKSSSTYGWQRTRNKKHQQNEYHSVTFISFITRPAVREITDVDE